VTHYLLQGMSVEGMSVASIMGTIMRILENWTD
jgi:hypothetical protein